MGRIKPFVTKDMPVIVKDVECYLNISLEKGAYLWNFAFFDGEEESIGIGYEDILSVLPQLKEETGLDLEVIVTRKKVTRKEFVNEYYVRANGKYLELGDEEYYTAEQMQSLVISTLASLIYHNEIFGLVKPEGKDDKHE